jgi:hypothetical protein
VIERHCGVTNSKRRSLNREVIVRSITLAAAIAAFVLTSGCKKTGEGEYQVEKPVIGTETDTVETPSVETGTVKDTISVPKVDVETPSEREKEAQ